MTTATAEKPERKSRLNRPATEPKKVAEDSNVFWRTMYERPNEICRVHFCEGHTVVMRVTITDDDGRVASDVFTPIYGAQIRTVNGQSRIIGGR